MRRTVAAVLIFGLFPVAAVPAPVPKDAVVDAKTELARLVGTWKVTSYHRDGVEVIGNDSGGLTITFDKDGAFTWGNDHEPSGKIARIDPSKNPKEIDYLFTAGERKGKTMKAIYKLDAETFTDCCAAEGEDTRPKEFKSTGDNRFHLLAYKRVKKDD